MSTETNTLTNADAKIQPRLGVKALVQIGMLSAIAIILMMFEIPLPFAPTFYKIDLSEVPVLVGCASPNRRYSPRPAYDAAELVTRL